MPQFSRQNLNFYYEVHGQGEPLFLIAGFSCHAELWRSLLDELSAHFQVIIFDNRGIGRSSSPKGLYTIEEMAEDALALIQHLKLKELSLLGHSMGGAIAQTISYKHPEYIKKCILCNTSAKFRACSALAEKFILTLREKGLANEEIAYHILPWIYSDSYLADSQNIQTFIELTASDPFPMSLDGFKGQLNALLTFDSRSWLQQIKVPALIISGGEDRLCLKDVRELKNLLPHAKELVFPNSGHIPFQEDPKTFLKGITEFLA